MFAWLFERVGAVYELIRLGVITRFRFNGPYWQWRLHTAFGREMPASKAELYRSIWDYARWVHRMRRG